MSCSLAVLAGAGCAEPEIPFDPASCEEPATFRIDQVEQPQTFRAVLAVSEDVNGDREIDNRIGELMAVFHSLFPLEDLDATVRDRLAGEVAWKLALRSCGPHIAVSLGRPERLDAHHLVSEAGALPPPDPAQSDAMPLLVRGDGAELPLSLLFDPDAQISSPGWIPASLGALRLTMTTDGARVLAKVSGAFALDAAFATMIPPLARYFDSYEGPHREVFDRFDTNGDGQLSDAELAATELLRELISADVEITGGEPAISFGLALSGVREP